MPDCLDSVRRPDPVRRRPVAKLILAGAGLVIAGLLAMSIPDDAGLAVASNNTGEVDRTSAQGPFEARIQAIEQRLDTLDGRGDRFQQLEQRLLQSRNRYEERLQVLERSVLLASSDNTQKFKAIERRLGIVADTGAYQERMRDMDLRMSQTSKRLDELAATIATIKGNDDAIMAVNSKTLAEPPSAVQIAPDVVSHIDPGQRESGQVRLVLSEPVPPGSDRSVGGMTAAQSAGGQTGEWVINLGSYSKQSIATRMMAEFRHSGADAEQVEAIVQGRTMYRVRVAGFDSWRAARQHAGVLSQQLKLEDAWVSRR